MDRLLIANLTKIVNIGNTAKEELLSHLGSGDVEVEFSLEWS